MDRGVQNRISILSNWRRGAALAAVSAGVLVASGQLDAAAGLVAIGIAAGVVLSAHFALHRFLRRCAVDPDLAGIAAVARFRQRLCSPRRRRLIAVNLRETALPPGHVRRSEFVPWDRVRLVRSELLALADELEATPSIDPRTMVDLERLLCDSPVSPLLNESIPECELGPAVRSIRFRVQSASVTGVAEPQPAARTRLKGRILNH